MTHKLHTWTWQATIHLFKILPMLRMLRNELINLSHALEIRWVQGNFVPADVQESPLCFSGIEFFRVAWFLRARLWQLRLQFCEQPGVIDCRTIVVGIASHHCELYIINVHEMKKNSNSW